MGYHGPVFDYKYGPTAKKLFEFLCEKFPKSDIELGGSVKGFIVIKNIGVKNEHGFDAHSVTLVNRARLVEFTGLHDHWTVSCIATKKSWRQARELVALALAKIGE